MPSTAVRPHALRPLSHSDRVPPKPMLRTWVAVYLLAAFGGAPLALALGGLSAVVSLSAVIAIMMVALVGYEWTRRGHPLGPAGVLAMGTIFLFSVRPLTIVYTGATSAGAKADEVAYTTGVAEDATNSCVMVIVFFAVFGVIYFALYERHDRAVVDGHRLHASSPASPLDRGHPSLATSGLLLVVFALAALGAVGYLVISSGGLSAYVSGLSNRSSFLADRAFLTYAYLPLSVMLFLYLLARQANGRRRTWDLLALAGLVILVGSAFVTGGRGPLLLGVALPLMLVNQLGPRPLKGGGFIFLGSAFIVAGLLLSVLLRDNVYDEGESLRNLSADPLGTLLSRITSGTDARPFDSLILLNSELGPYFQFQGGKTYLATATFFLPGAIAGEKEGGNTWFTSTYLPRFFYPNHVETSISAIGEAYANFWWIGIVAIAAILAYLAYRVSLNVDAKGVLGRLIYVSLTPIFFSFLRGDAFHNVPLALLALVLAVIGARVAQPPGTGRTAVRRRLSAEAWNRRTTS